MSHICAETALVASVVTGEEGGELICCLDADHPGLHYDEVDHISWQKGTRDDQP